MKVDVEALARQVTEQIRWANNKAVQAEEHGDVAGVEAWHGYGQALRWVLSLHPFASTPALSDPTRDTA